MRIGATVLTAVAGLLAGCGAGTSTACPAIGYLPSVRVELTGDWSGHPVGSVQLDCSPPCERITLDDPPAEAGPPVLSWIVPSGPLPDSAVATVLAPDGSVLAEVEADLDFERVGGSAECGGPMEATAEVPAP
ncbi:hypothetical protein [Modestobacter sp. SYSU DS0657]